MPSTQPPHSVAALTRPASNKVIPARTRVGNQQVELAARVKDDAVRPGRAAAVHAVARHDGELVPRARGREVEALVVVVPVGVVVWRMMVSVCLPTVPKDIDFKLSWGH